MWAQHARGNVRRRTTRGSSRTFNDSHDLIMETIVIQSRNPQVAPNYPKNAVLNPVPIVSWTFWATFQSLFCIIAVPNYKKRVIRGLSESTRSNCKNHAPCTCTCTCAKIRKLKVHLAIPVRFCKEGLSLAFLPTVTCSLMRLIQSSILFLRGTWAPKEPYYTRLISSTLSNLIWHSVHW